MLHRALLALLAGATLAFSGVGAVAQEFGQAQAKLRTIPLQVGGHTLTAEVAATLEQRMRGMMFRKEMGRNDGMLFVFEEPAYQGMWMKNTLIPLSVAFLDKDGRILNIRDMQPQTLDHHGSDGPALYAIETNVGWFAERKIKTGDRVTGLPRPAK
jgi:uncharacterized membrane protein (UPF0127 family)